MGDRLIGIVKEVVVAISNDEMTIFRVFNFQHKSYST